MTPQTRLYKLMDRASMMLGVGRDDYHFFYLDEIIQDDDTPESTAMEDLGVIEMHGVI